MHGQQRPTTQTQIYQTTDNLLKTIISEGYQRQKRHVHVYRMSFLIDRKTYLYGINRTRNMFCQKCGVENKDNAAFCKSCGTQFNVKEELSADESWNAVNALTRWSIGIFLILIFVSNLAEENGIGIIGIIFGTIIGYYWLAPATVNLAREHNRNISWAYFIGFCICLLGFVIYWIYVTLTNDPQMLYGVQGEINEKMQDEPKK